MSSGRVDVEAVNSLEAFRLDVKADMEMEFIRWKVNVVGGVGGFGII